MEIAPNLIHAGPKSPARQKFLTATSLLAAAAATPNIASGLANDSSSNNQVAVPAGPARKIPIGVFDPVFPDLSLDQMIDKISGWDIEAVEIGTGGYPGDKHCPVQESLSSPAKVQAWKKKFEDRNILVATLSCHGNPVHPDPIAERDAAIFRNTVLLAERLGVGVIVGFSGCPGGSPNETMPNWATYRWPPEYAQILDWQWKEKVIPYWKQAAKFAATTACISWLWKWIPGLSSTIA